MEKQNARLEDMLNYQMAEYFSPDEVQLIRSTFRSQKVLKLLRKAFIPTISDPDLPIEQMGNDMWFAGDRKWDQIPNEEAKSLIVARCETIKFVVNALIRLQVLANSNEETPVEKAQRIGKDSAR